MTRQEVPDHKYICLGQWVTIFWRTPEICLIKITWGQIFLRAYRLCLAWWQAISQQPRPISESSLTSSVTGFKIENCSIKRSSLSLDAWADESNAAQSESVRAKKYLKLKTAEISKNLILTRKQRTIVDKRKNWEIRYWKVLQCIYLDFIYQTEARGTC